ncbi:unnamed protein product, partial [Rotaria sp. Silwood1]
DLDGDDDDRRQAEEKITKTSHDEEEVIHDDEIKLVYFASATPKQHLIDILSVSYKDTQDFSEQLELKFKELKEEQKDILKLYRAAKLSSDELANFQNSIGNLISCSGYLSTSGEYSVAYGFATKSPKREGFEGAVFEYIVDLDVVQNIVLAVIHEYSAFPEEAEVIVDIGQRKNKISIFIYRSIEID